MIITRIMRRLCLLLIAVTWIATTRAQSTPTPLPSEDNGAWKQFVHQFDHAFNHLDLSLTTGSTGVGFDLSMPVTDWLSVRGGYAIMPRFSYRMHFGVEVGDDPTTSEAKFNRLSGLLNDFTGNKVDNVVDVMGKPTYWNWKLLVDVRPFRNKKWHLTAGVFMGNSQVAEAVNAIEDMPSLMAVNIYNNLYDRAMNNELEFTVGETTANLSDLLVDKLKNYGRMSINMGEYSHDILYEEDEIMVAPEGGIVYNGMYYFEGDQIVVHKAGDVMHKKGDAYRMTPDENSMVKAWAYANRVKPYLGFGYGGKLSKSDPRWELSFDCGAMFWGGTPRIVTHDGTDLVHDVDNVHGKVGDYVNIIKKFKVFPVLNIRLTRRLF